MKTSSAPALAFGGQYRDPLTGNYPLGNGRRFYSPTLMRFMAYDAMSPFSKGGINGYVYCGADPVNRYDPSGASWLSILLRGIGLVSSGVTLFGAIVRTMRNIVGRRSAFRASTGAAASDSNTQSPSAANTTNATQASHQELPHFSRVSNLNFTLTGAFGVSNQVTAAIYGLSPNIQALTDVFAFGNTVTNLNGGATGNITAAREVFGYLRRNPREIVPVAWETTMDVTMVDESLSALVRGSIGAVRRIRSTRPVPHGVQV